MRYFETRFLEDVDEFISKLDKKSASKVFYNIDIAEQTNDHRLFKKLEGEIWEFRSIWETKIDCLPFGIKQNQQKRLCWQPAAL